MARLVVAALALVAVAAVAFVAEVRRIAAGLDVTPADGPLEGISWGQSGPHLTFNTGMEQPDDSEVVGMPTWRIVGGVVDPVRTESSGGWCGSCGAWYIPGGLHICTPRTIFGSASWRTNG